MSCKKVSSETTVERSNVILQTVTMEAHLWCLVFYWHLFSVHVQQHFVYSELYYTEYLLTAERSPETVFLPLLLFHQCWQCHLHSAHTSAQK